MTHSVEGVGELRAGQTLLGGVTYSISIPDGTIFGDKAVLRQAAQSFNITLTIPAGFVLNLRIVDIDGGSARISVRLPLAPQESGRYRH